MNAKIGVGGKALAAVLATMEITPVRCEDRTARKLLGNCKIMETIAAVRLFL